MAAGPVRSIGLSSSFTFETDDRFLTPRLLTVRISDEVSQLVFDTFSHGGFTATKFLDKTYLRAGYSSGGAGSGTTGTGSPAGVVVEVRLICCRCWDSAA